MRITIDDDEPDLLREDIDPVVATVVIAILVPLALGAFILIGVPTMFFDGLGRLWRVAKGKGLKP